MSKKDLILPEVKRIISEYSMRLTLRQIFYRLVAKQKLENTVNNYKYLSRILVDARYDEYIPFTAIEDRTRAPVGGDDELRSPDSHFNLYLNAFKHAHLHFKMPRWEYQDKYVEVWMEKEALSGLFKQITDKHNVTLATCRGYPSLTFLYEGAQRIGWVEDKELVILYFGDFDPSGEDIYRYIQETLENFGIEATFIKVAIDMEQIREYNIPPAPTKKTDARAANFIAEHGDLAVELDAIEPDALQGIIDDAVSEHFDERSYDLVVREQAAHRDEIRKMVGEIIKED